MRRSHCPSWVSFKCQKSCFFLHNAWFATIISILNSTQRVPFIKTLSYILSFYHCDNNLTKLGAKMYVLTDNWGAKSTIRTQNGRRLKTVSHTPEVQCNPAILFWILRTKFSAEHIVLREQWLSINEILFNRFIRFVHSRRLKFEFWIWGLLFLCHHKFLQLFHHLWKSFKL